MNRRSEDRPFHLPSIEHHRTRGGLEVFLVPWHTLPLVNLDLILPAGAEADPPGKGGLADLVAEMFTLGTKKQSASELAARVDGMGASLSAHAGWDCTSVHVFGLREDLGSLLNLLLEVYAEPAFAPEEFAQLKKRHIALLTQQKDDSSLQADEAMTQILFRGTPYDHPSYGSLKTVPSLSIEEAQNFYHEHFLPEGSFLVVSGDVRADEVLPWIDAHFPPPAKREGGGDILPPASPAPGMRCFLLSRPDLTQSQIRMGHLGIPHAHEDFIPFEVMNYALGGGGFSSRLMQRIRVELGYTYGIRASLEPRRNPGPYCISTFTPTETTFPCIQEILQVLRSFQEEGPKEFERTEAIRFLTGSYPMKFETPGQMAQRLIQAKIHGLDLSFLSTYPQRVAEVSLETMRRCAQTHLHPDRMTVVVVGRSDPFRSDLERLGPVESME
jgi:zinc protease